MNPTAFLTERNPRSEKPSAIATGIAQIFSILHAEIKFYEKQAVRHRLPQFKSSDQPLQDNATAPQRPDAQ